MKLHLGCGNLKLPNYINIDLLSAKADIKLDITNLSIFNNNTIDEIYVSHTLEHFNRNKILCILLEWNRVLKDGGILRIAVPDFEKVVKIYNKNHDITELIGFLNGGQRNIYDFHYINFDIHVLTAILTTCGYSEIERYESHDFLGNCDDYSKSYIPHMDMHNGELMSLNVTCKKISDIKYDDIVLPNNLKKYLRHDIQ